MAINYRDLLIRYIAHVSSCEGFDFIEHGLNAPESDVTWSEAESKELELLAEESKVLREELSEIQKLKRLESDFMAKSGARDAALAKLEEQRAKIRDTMGDRPSIY